MTTCHFTGLRIAVVDPRLPVVYTDAKTPAVAR